MAASSHSLLTKEEEVAVPCDGDEVGVERIALGDPMLDDHNNYCEGLGLLYSNAHKKHQHQ